MPDPSAPDADHTLSVRLEIQLDRQPIRGHLRTDTGAEETFVGWLGFVDALQRLQLRLRQQDPNRAGERGKPPTRFG
jgi:hypothetical protein